MNNAQYARVIIKGTLTTQTALHIGTGETENYSDENTANSIVQDAKGQPYIPASTLRGSLRSVCPNTEIEEIIYGSKKERKDSESQGNIGAIRIYDAPVATQCEQTDISRTQIDAVTGTATQHSLSTHKLVPENTVFNLEIQLDNVSKAAINTLLASLKALQYNRLGKGKSIGQGQISWKLDEENSQLLSKEALKQWLNTNKEEALSSKYSKLKNYIKQLKRNKQAKINIDQTWQKIDISLLAQNPILINDPKAVAKEEEKAQTDQSFSAKKAIAMQRTSLKKAGSMKVKLHEAIIPASTLKGWLRARCEKIIRTIDAEIPEKKLLNQLFGGTEEGQSLLHFSDAKANFTPSKDQHEQTFIAVDRFTGGVKTGALYTVRAIFPASPYTTQIHYQENTLKPWMKLLLLYAYRDAIEGDLIVGWGKSKGFGQLKLKADFQHTVKQYEHQLEDWQQDLDEELNKLKATQCGERV